MSSINQQSVKMSCQCTCHQPKKPYDVTEAMITIIKDEEFIYEVSCDLEEGYTLFEALDRNAGYFAEMELPYEHTEEQYKELTEIMWGYAGDYFNKA